jgi:predicted TIM-barrel fold metal-dependent hydrolase
VIIPYGHVSVDNPKVIQEIQTFADAGFRGVKMHTPKYNWDDFGYFPIYDKLQSLRLVVLFHTGIVSGDSDEPEPFSMARMRPSFLHTIARSFPKLVIQGAHLGNPCYDEAAEAARWEKYLYFDLTGSSLLKKAKNLAVFKDYLWWEGPTAHSSPDAVYAFEKLVFGTDEAPERNANRRTDICATAASGPRTRTSTTLGDPRRRTPGQRQCGDFLSRVDRGNSGPRDPVSTRQPVEPRGKNSI